MNGRGTRSALPTRILGVGSPHGDDQAGWRLVERLRRLALPDAEPVALGEASQLLDALEGCGRLLIIDACRAGASPGTITRLEWPDDRIAQRHGRSTHGLGLAELLRLAQTLGKLPPQVVLFGVEMECWQAGADLSARVEQALPELERRVVSELTKES